MRTIGAVTAILAVVALAAPSAQNREHQQLMAEIRMLQEQQQQLQHVLGGLTETLKAITVRMEEQAGTSRKAFADQKLLIDSVAEAARILREKSDDTNVRLSAMAQEIQALRQTVAALPPPLAVLPSGDPTTGGEPGAVAAAQPANPNQVPPGVSPAEMWSRIFADYTAGQYDLAISGFEAFIRAFPTAYNADDAQLYIGNSYYNAGNFKEALGAYQRVISEYPKTDSVPQAWYKLGQTYERLTQMDAARKAYETLVRDYPSSNDAVLAKTRLDSMRK